MRTLHEAEIPGSTVSLPCPIQPPMTPSGITSMPCPHPTLHDLK